jgi:hypothetical protein
MRVASINAEAERPFGDTPLLLFPERNRHFESLNRKLKREEVAALRGLHD